MKIEGLPLDNGGLKNITDRKTPKPAPAGRMETSDTVELTGGMGRRELVELSRSTPAEFPVREAVVQAVKQRVASGGYDSPDVREKTAERMVESPALSGAAISAAIPNDSGQSERVESAGARAAENFYNRPDVLASTAMNLINALTK